MHAGCRHVEKATDTSVEVMRAVIAIKSAVVLAGFERACIKCLRIDRKGNSRTRLNLDFYVLRTRAAFRRSSVLLPSSLC